MRISKNGLKLLEQVEGQNKKNGLHVMYIDSGGAPTIGFGHLLTKSERTSGKIIIGTESIKWSFGLTDQQAENLLDQDLDIAESGVNRYTKVILTQNQFDALVAFTFNVGVEAYSTSTLIKLLNQGNYDQIPAQLMRWVYDNGQKVQGLVNRRSFEVEMWEGRY